MSRGVLVNIQRLCLGSALVLAIAMGTGLAQDEGLRFRLEAKQTGILYDVEVVLPAGPAVPDARYPVVYCMDWFILRDYLKSLPGLMAMGRVAEPFVMVGISQGSTSDDWAVMRTRDFTPDHPTDDYSKSFMYESAIDKTGGAGRFAGFLKDELIPYVESRYPCDPSRRCFLGYSLGGLLGVDLMTTEPGVFQYYLLGSPSLWFNEYYLADRLKDLPAERLAGVKRVYVSVGEEESWEMLRSFDIVRSGLKQKGIRDPRVKAEIIGSAGHVGAMPISLYNGLRFLFPGK